MKRQKSHKPGIGTFGKAAAAAAFLGCTVVPHVAYAQAPQSANSGIYVTILSPKTNVSDPSQQIKISAFYQAASVTGGVTTLELWIDGQQEAVQKLTTPDFRSVVTFVLSPGTLTAGNHSVVVRVSATDAEVASVVTNLNVAQPQAVDNTPAPALGGDTDTGSAPAVAIMAPITNATIEGTVDIKVDAHDDSGKPPYVSLFIDHNFKTLRNYPPFDFAWDTTRVANGYHTIEVWGYNDDQAVGHASPITVYVNNPGGRTLVRHDLLDTVPTDTLARMIKPAPVVAPGQHHAVAEAVKAPAALAKGDAVVVKPASAKLASAEIGQSSSDLSEQTELMAPFLSLKVPHIDPTAAANVAKALPAPPLIAKPIKTTVSDNQPLSAGATENSVWSGSTELVEPAFEEMMPIKAATAAPIPAKHYLAFDNQAALPTAPVHLTALSAMTSSDVDSTSAIEAPTFSTKIVVSPVVNPMAEPIKPEVKVASATIPASVFTPSLVNELPKASSTLHFDSQTSTVSVDTDTASLETPNATLVTVPVAKPVVVHPTVAAHVETPALLASGEKVTEVTIGYTRIASASIDSSQLFTPQTNLLTPDLTQRHVVNIISTHQVTAELQPLGSSNAGFPVQDVQRAQIVMNDRPVVLNQPLQDRKKFLFAPFRQIFESEGGVMSWNASSHTVHALNGSRDIELTIGSKAALVNQQTVTMNASPYLTSGHTMIPLAFVPIALNATVSYDPASGHIVINSKD